MKLEGNCYELLSQNFESSSRKLATCEIESYNFSAQPFLPVAELALFTRNKLALVEK